MCGWRTSVALLLGVGALLATGLTSTSAQAAGTTPLVAHGSVEQAYATGLPRQATATLLRHGARVQTRRADAAGGVLFRGLAPGGGYQIRSDPRNRRRAPPYRAGPPCGLTSLGSSPAPTRCPASTSGASSTPSTRAS